MRDLVTYWIEGEETVVLDKRVASVSLKERLSSYLPEGYRGTFDCKTRPVRHHKHLKSTIMLERLMEEIKLRTHVVRIFPNTDRCLRLIRALAVEMNENWIEAVRYSTMEYLKQHKKEALRRFQAA